MCNVNASSQERNSQFSNSSKPHPHNYSYILPKPIKNMIAIRKPFKHDTVIMQPMSQYHGLFWHWFYCHDCHDTFNTKVRHMPHRTRRPISNQTDLLGRFKTASIRVKGYLTRIQPLLEMWKWWGKGVIILWNIKIYIIYIYIFIKRNKMI